MIKNGFRVFGFCVLSLLMMVPTGFSEETLPSYLFSFFMKNGEDGLYLAHSQDGLTWEAANNQKPILAPKVGESVLMRDPCPLLGPDGVFHMVWTAGWWEKGIGIAHSKDLVKWSEQDYIPVMKHEPTARNCWAPEIFYDDVNDEYIIFWATTIPGRFPETSKMGDDQLNHRMYCVTTKDFESYTDTRLFYEPGFNVIDSTIAKVDDNKYVMFLKNETLNPAEKNIRVSFAEQPAGPWGAASEPITGDYWAEGPTSIQIGDYWYVYFDKYRKHKYGAVRSKDLNKWEDVSDQLSMPEGMRHGTVFQVEPDVMKKVLNLGKE